MYDLSNKTEERSELWKDHLEGPTIIYVPTRKETLSIAKFLCKFGVKAAAYNAKVVVATIAFGMGIDKSNVRRIIHYGWPQSLEAYYQEAGRAGRDGKLADCILYVNLSRIPSLLPSRRSEDQTKQAYKMLSDCFRYGMNTSSCRAKTLVEYFGEEFSHEKCQLCDVCVNGPPEMLNLKAEAEVFIRVVAAHYGQGFAGGLYDNIISIGEKHGRHMEKPNIWMFVGRIREQFQEFVASDRLWWRGLTRILEDKGFIREVDDTIRVQIKFPEPTKLGLEFLRREREQPFYVYPEADMLLSLTNDKPYSSFSEWGKGWADPEIRRQRLGRLQVRRKPSKRKGKKPSNRKGKKHHPDLKTVRGRLAARLSKQK
ncbi:DNA helicase [Sarracenia purpurea var. burkii]